MRITLNPYQNNHFGADLTSKNTVSNGRINYIYGYQSSEMDNEVKGKGNSYTTYFRQLDPRLGRWLTIDPKASAWESPYVSMGNNPIWFNDVLGDKFIIGNKDKQAKKDVKSLVKDKNQDYLKFDESSGEVSVSFGDLGEKAVNKILRKDKGLKLINNLSKATDEKGNDLLFFYGTEGSTNIGLENPLKQSKIGNYYSDISGLEGKGNEVNDEFGGFPDSRAFILNASTTPYSKTEGKYKTYGLVPLDDYDGKTFIAKGSFKRMYSSIGNNGFKTNYQVTIIRAEVVFHELDENLKRTLHGMPYKKAHRKAGGKSNFTNSRFYTQ